MNPDQFYSYILFDAMRSLGILIVVMGFAAGVIRQLKRIADNQNKGVDK